MGRTFQDRNNPDHTERIEEDEGGPGAGEKAHTQTKEMEPGSKRGE